MKTSSCHLHRTLADRVPPAGTRRRNRFFTTGRRAAIAAMVCLGWLPAVCAAQEIVREPDASSALQTVPWPPEGRQLLVVTLALFVALVLMERLCDWRLRVRRSQAQAASQALLKVLSHAAFPLSVAPRRTVGSSRVRFLVIVAALGTFQITSPALSAQTVYVANADNNYVGAYSAATGSPVTGFTSPTGLSAVGDVAISGSTLYVVDYYDVRAYNAATGAPVTSFGGPTNLNGGQDLAIAGNTLYVSEITGDDVRAFNVTTGAPVAGFALSGGIHEPAQIAVTGNILYLARGGDGLIGTYNATTGAPINPSFISLISAGRFPFGLALSGGTLYVSDFNGSTISEYDANTGALLNGSFITGLQRPTGLTLSGNTLYVANSAGNTVGAYNALTGAPAAGFTSPAGLDNPFGVAVATVPEPGPCVFLALCAVAGVVWRRRRSAAGRVNASRQRTLRREAKYA